MGMGDVQELAKWARRASRAERFAKLQTARVIFGERRLRCRLVGCTNLESTEPCSRCGAKGRDAKGRGPQAGPGRKTAAAG
jgi:hypothetical protein